MGTINYRTSDYITLGIVPLDIYDVEHDADIMEELTEQVKEYGGTIEDAICSYIRDAEDDDYDNIRYIIDDFRFDHIRVDIIPGYHAGFYLDIEFTPDDDLTDDERRNIRYELYQLENLLEKCADCGMVEVTPGWCTHYSTYDETLTAIHDAIGEMLEDLAAVPAYNEKAVA